MKQILTIGILAIPFLFNCCVNSKLTDEEKEELAKKSYVEKQTVQVKTDLVKLGNFSRELVSNGVLVAREKAVVTFKVNEKVKKVNVEEGQSVKAGQLLAALDDFTFYKRLQDARINYEKSLIDLEDMLLGYGYSMKDTAKVPENIIKMCRIRSNINTASLSLEEAKRNLADTKLTAPISGVVCNLEAKENNHSSQYKTCCEILDNSSMEVEFHVLEGEMDMVKKGSKVEVLPFALPQYSTTGTIASINPTVENGLIKIRAVIPNIKGKLIDGMSVKILVKNNVPDCIIIPKSAVLYRQNRKVVFVHKDSVAFWTYVETGLENSTQVTITDNSLKQGEEVIVANNINLAHETPVVVVN